MIRKLVIGASALALAFGGIVVGITPATAAKVKMGGVLNCSNTDATGTFLPALTFTPVKKSVLTFNSTATGCVVTNPTGGAQAITQVSIQGTAKIKNATATMLVATAPYTPYTLKITMQFKNSGGGVLCTNKAKVVPPPTLITFPTSFYWVTSNLDTGKALGGKCFKKAGAVLTGPLDQTVPQLTAAANGAGVGIITLTDELFFVGY